MPYGETARHAETLQTSEPRHSRDGVRTTRTWHPEARYEVERRPLPRNQPMWRRPSEPPTRRGSYAHRQRFPNFRWPSGRCFGCSPPYRCMGVAASSCWYPHVHCKYGQGKVPPRTAVYPKGLGSINIKPTICRPYTWNRCGETGQIHSYSQPHPQPMNSCAPVPL